MNICPSRKSFIYLLKRIKRLIFTKNSSANKNEGANGNRDDRLDDLNLRRRNNNNKTTQHDQFKNEGIFDRQRSSALHEKLTYKIVVERIVKRFLLYYKNKHIGIDETNEGLEFKEFKNDISSLRFELFNEVDLLDEMHTSVTQTMTKLNDDLQVHFDFEHVRHYLNNQKN
jgi:hypothetical protein